MLLLTESDVRRLLPMEECIGVLREAFRSFAQKDAQNQPRRRLVLPTGCVLHSLGGAQGKYFGTKFYSTHPKHGFYFLFVLYDAVNAKPLALFEANYLGQIRTGAACGLATDLMARKTARTLAIIGSGFQARSQLEAMLAVRPIESVRVWSRSPEKRERFAEECASLYQPEIQAVETAQVAVRDADIVVTATYAAEPVLRGEWLAPGTHVNAMGSNNPKRCEIPADVVRSAGMVVADSIEQCRLEAGDLVLALDEEGWSRVIELADLVSGRHDTPEGQITLFKSVGLGLEDVAAAGYAYERALSLGVGSDFRLLHS